MAYGLRQFGLGLGFALLVVGVWASDWQEAFVLEEPRANLELAVRSETDAPLRLRLQAVDQDGVVEFVFDPTASTVAVKPTDAFPSAFAERSLLNALPESVDPDTEWRILTLKRRPRGWVFYLDAVPFVQLPEVFAGPVAIHLPSAQLAEGDDVPEPFLQRIGEVAFEDGFMIPPDTENGLVNWEILSGDWGLHVIERSDVQQQRGGSRVPTAERSPNFYSLHGLGEPALILTGTEFDDHYLFRASVQHHTGTNGVAFFYNENTGAYQAFTAETDPVSGQVRLRLWRQNADGDGTETLAVYQTDRLPGQWLLLEAQVFDDRVTLRLNHQTIETLTLGLPPGGRFGLYAHNAEGARFDDVWSYSHQDVPLQDASDWRRLTQIERGALEVQTPPEAERPVVIVQSDAPAQVRFGAPGDAPRRLEVKLWLPAEGNGEAGLALGDPDSERGRYRLVLQRAAEDRLAVSLNHEHNGERRECDRFELPAPAADQPIRLTLDSTREGEIRGLIDDRLAVVDAPVPSVSGSACIFAPPGARFSLPETRRFPLRFEDQAEDNPQYIEDRFMRHWASPEGQWVTFPDGLTWFRGDAFRGVTVSFPVLSPSELHLAIPSKGTNGLVRLVTEDGICRLVAPSNGDAPATVAEWPLTNVLTRTLGDLGEHPVLTVRLEDHCLWVTSGDRLLWRGHVDITALREGTRMRLQGLEVEALHHVLVRRDAVLDVLFTDSPYDWTLHGGRWEVVNRFACEPTWSHMGGENSDGLAALWSGFTFRGDFCVEMFAGARHGWYDRVGDMNLTVMNRRQTPGDGYTVIGTGWDADWSQDFSRLWVNGQLTHTSTNYLAPRRREGNRRQGYEPLLASGRDVHGAWYSLRFRRVGGRLHYSFDNVPVFDLPDETPVTEGGLGLWTFRNSIMVARARIAAESIQPARLDIRPVPRDAWAAVAPTPDADVSPQDARHAVTLDAARWSATPCPAEAVLSVRMLDAEPVLRLDARRAGGLLHARPDFPILPTAQLAGWRFELARLPETALNAAFTFGALDSDGAFAEAEAVSFVLSGTDSPRGPRQILPGAKIAPTPEDAFPEQAHWTSVVLWLPLDRVVRHSHVRFDGFGNLQPSDVQQALGVNPPGAAYAVRRLEPLWYGGSPSGHAFERIGEVVAAPKPDAWRVAWSDSHAHMLELSASVAHPPRLPEATVLLNGQTVTPIVRQDRWLVPLPLPLPETEVKGLTLSASLGANLTLERTLQLPEDLSAHPPVLQEINYPGVFRRFVFTDPVPEDVAIGQTQVSLRWDPEWQTGVLRLANDGAEARLASVLANGADLIANPVLAFAYRADALARVSIEMPTLATLPFLEPGPGGDLPLPGVADGQRQTFQTIMTQWLGHYPLNRARQVSQGTVRFRSTHSIDRTGRYAWIDLEHFALGPAVGPQRPLMLTPTYAAVDGIEQVEMALVPYGETLDDVALAALAWQAIANGESHTVDFADHPNGPGFVGLRARGKRGAVSRLTPLPFLLDTHADTLRLSLSATPAQGRGTRLDAEVDSQGGSPLDVRRLALRCDDTAMTLDPNFVDVRHRPEGAVVEFALPPLLREQLDHASDGQAFSLTVDGLRDGAQNAIAAQSITYTVDHAADQRPPTLHALNTLASPIFWIGCLGPEGSGLGQVQHALQQVERKPDGSVQLSLEFQHDRGNLTQAFTPKPWKPDDHPYLAISVQITEGLPSNASAPFVLVLTATEEVFPQRNRKVNTLRIPLEPHRSQFTRHMNGTLSWRPGQWNDLIINVRELARRAAGTNKTPEIQSIALRTPKGVRAKLQVRAFVILGDWQENLNLIVDAYDASGISGLRWQGEGAQSERTLLPGGLLLPEGDTHWVRARVADHPGNETLPILIPVPTPFVPPDQPKPEAVDEAAQNAENDQEDFVVDEDEEDPDA